MKKQKSKREIRIPEQERAIRTKNKILKAATKVFAEKGLHGSRIHDITRLSKVNRERIYAYFGSKQNLYQAVLIANYSIIANEERLHKLTPDDLPRMTNILITVFLEFHAKNPHFWRLLSWENLENGRNLSREQWGSLHSAYIEHLARLYTIGQERGFFRHEISAKAYIFTVFSVTYFYYSNQLTLSNLLDMNFDNEDIRLRIERELIYLVKQGTEC